MTASTAQKPALWTRNFTTCAAANFLLFFSFYQLLPILPMFIIEKFQTDNATAGIVISLYTIGALACRPFAGFLVDTLSRKPLYFWTFFAFTLCFIGYKTLGLIPLLAVLRFMHGLCFGISTTASNTVAIDALPSSRRGEGIGYFGISVNLAFATGPMTGMFLYEAFGDNIVERVVKESGIVSDCVAFRDEMNGKVCISLATEKELSQKEIETIQSIVRDKLSKWSVPTKFVKVDSISVTELGKTKI